MKLYTALPSTSVTEFSYRYGDADKAHIFMSLSLMDRARNMPAIIASLEEQGMKAMDASENEMAKSHCRYLVRGRGVRPDWERFFRFSFPERPGALKHFLETLPSDVNGARFFIIV